MITYNYYICVINFSLNGFPYTQTYYVITFENIYKMKTWKPIKLMVILKPQKTSAFKSLFTKNIVILFIVVDIVRMIVNYANLRLLYW